MGLGDAVECSEDEDEKNDGRSGEQKKRGSGLPGLEGSETCEAFVQKYKKTLLNKRSSLKDAKERLTAENCTSSRCLGHATCMCRCVLCLSVCFLVGAHVYIHVCMCHHEG